MFPWRSSTGLFICASQIIKLQDARAMSESQCAQKKMSDKRKKSSLEREGGSETDMGERERENKRKREGD